MSALGSGTVTSIWVAVRYPRVSCCKLLDVIISASYKKISIGNDSVPPLALVTWPTVLSSGPHSQGAYYLCLPRSNEMPPARPPSRRFTQRNKECAERVLRENSYFYSVQCPIAKLPANVRANVGTNARANALANALDQRPEPVVSEVRRRRSKRPETVVYTPALSANMSANSCNSYAAQLLDSRNRARVP